MNPRQEKSFGYVIALLLLAWGAWRLYSGGAHGAYLLAAAAGLAVMTALFPVLWRPVLRVWMPFARVLGWINTRLLLGVVFFVLITPVGLVARLVGHDPLRLRGRGAWVERGKDWPPASFKDSF